MHLVVVLDLELEGLRIMFSTLEIKLLRNLPRHFKSSLVCGVSSALGSRSKPDPFRTESRQGVPRKDPEVSRGCHTQSRKV